MARQLASILEGSVVVRGLLGGAHRAVVPSQTANAKLECGNREDENNVEGCCRRDPGRTLKFEFFLTALEKRDLSKSARPWSSMGTSFSFSNENIRFPHKDIQAHLHI